MRLDSLARRFLPALLGALVVLASLASAAHTHVAPGHGVELAAEGDSAEDASLADFGCALCAHGERAAHGVHAIASALDADPRPTLARGCELASPRRVLLERLAPRAPPRIG